MPGLYDVEVEPEVGTWLDSLSDRDFGRVDFLVGVARRAGRDPGRAALAPWAGKVCELRFHLLRQQTRVTYRLAPGRRVVLLTVFHKTRSAETAEVQRAIRAQQVCETRHVAAADVYHRRGERDE